MHRFLSLLSCAVLASAQTFYTLDLRTPGDVNITVFQGTLKVPEYPPGYPASGETYYLWPGLQGTQVSGVFQQVMSPQGSGGTWSIDSGYYSSSDGQPFQGGVSGLNPGQELYFHNFRNDGGTWTTQFAYAGQPVTVTDNFDHFQGLAFNLAVFAIELYDAPWNFGQFAFYDVYITWLGSDTSSCTNDSVQNYNGGDFSYTVEGASATVGDGQVTCYFSQISLDAPPSSS